MIKLKRSEAQWLAYGMRLGVFLSRRGKRLNRQLGRIRRRGETEIAEGTAGRDRKFDDATHAAR
ncbi:MAG TPA: hypothetical protein VLS27_14620 [Gammaproteobacteria bacterium]|nr:hypothetical protein [Gammaproteobacteria bacterium]